jgi:hypothetical protein
LQDVEDALASNSTSSAVDAELRELIDACETALNDLSALVDNFNSLPLQSQRTWDRLSWGQDSENDLRQRLSNLTGQLTAFYRSLKNSPTAQIDRALQQLAKEVSNGRHETSTVTSLSITAVDPDDESGWDQMVRDLGDLGIAEKVVNEYKAFIVDWILRAINDDILTDEKMPVEPETIPLPHSPPPRPPKTPVLANTVPPIATRSTSPPYLAVDPQRRPSLSPPGLRPAISTDVLNQVSSINMDDPPSPIEPAAPETNILWNAQRISYHWNRREWKQVRENIEAQIACVERGEYVDISGFPQQPDGRILKHLLGICYSLAGDFIKARETFASVVSSANVQNLALDDGDIAAARWLGETCIMSSQVLNAALAWAIAYYGMWAKGDQAMNGMLEDLRLLNIRTSGLNILKNAFVNSNRDASTILGTMAGTTKFQMITKALEALAGSQRREIGPRRLPQNIQIAEGFLIQPLVAQKSWPLPQDPFFRVDSSIDLLYALSRPRMQLITISIPSASLGNSKSLTYVTKNSVEWLVEAIRYALNTYAVEWKIRYSEYLLRLSQTNDRIAYYDCFAIKFRKLSFRNLYGFKLSESAYATRQFTSLFRFREDGQQGPIATQLDEQARKERVRVELAERLKDYVKQAEIDLANGKWPPVDVSAARAPYEMDSVPAFPSELGDQRAGWELAGQGIRRKPVHEPMSYEIAELPG